MLKYGTINIRELPEEELTTREKQIVEDEDYTGKMIALMMFYERDD